MVDQSQDLEGNIRIDSSREESKGTGGFRSEDNRAGSRASSQHSAIEGETFNTLDEPVSETIVSVL